MKGTMEPKTKVSNGSYGYDRFFLISCFRTFALIELFTLSSNFFANTT